MAAVASHDDKYQLISDEWTNQVEELLKAEEPLEVRTTATRVSTAMLSAKPEAYIPQILSLGPLHHHAFKAVSVGPHQQHLTHISEMEMYKLKFAHEAAGCNAAVIKQIATELMKPLLIKKVEHFYDWSIRANTSELRNFSLMMTVDAFFLFQLLIKYFDDDHCMPSIASVRCDILKLENQIPLFLLLQVRDAVTAEQQPFHLLSRIESLSPFQIPHAAGKPAKGEKPREAIKTPKGEKPRAATKTSKVEKPHTATQIQEEELHHANTKILEGEEHLLGCIHKYVSSFLEIQPAEQNQRSPSCRQQVSKKMGSMAALVQRIATPVQRFLGQDTQAQRNEERDPENQHDSGCNPDQKGQLDVAHDPLSQGQNNFLKRYNAEELVKAGITIKPFLDEATSKIRFDKFFRRLYLPKIEVVGDYTEVMLRNLVALELNEPRRRKAVTSYVALMDRLIETPKDVTLLRVSGIIVCRSMMITDEYVAEMFNGMCKTLLGLPMEAPFALMISEMNMMLFDHFYKTRFRTWWGDFRRLYLGNPWDVVGLLVRIFLVVVVQFMTVVQSILGFNLKGLCND